MNVMRVDPLEGDLVADQLATAQGIAPEVPTALQRRCRAGHIVMPDQDVGVDPRPKPRLRIDGVGERCSLRDDQHSDTRSRRRARRRTACMIAFG